MNTYSEAPLNSESKKKKKVENKTTKTGQDPSPHLTVNSKPIPWFPDADIRFSADCNATPVLSMAHLRLHRTKTALYVFPSADLHVWIIWVTRV
jgi:hypothetical protein